MNGKTEKKDSFHPIILKKFGYAKLNFRFSENFPIFLL